MAQSIHVQMVVIVKRPWHSTRVSYDYDGNQKYNFWCFGTAATFNDT